MCSKRQLSTVHKLSDKPVIVECIRCTALGDKVLPVRPPEAEAFHRDGLINVTDGMFTQRVETLTPDMNLETEPQFETRPYTKVAVHEGTNTVEQQLESVATSEEHVTTGDVVELSHGSSTADLTSPSVDGIQNIEYAGVTTKIVPILEQNEVASAPSTDTTSESWHSTMETLLVTFPAQTDQVDLTDQISTDDQKLATQPKYDEATIVQELSSSTFEPPKSTIALETSFVSSTTTTVPQEGDVSTREQTPTDGQPLVTVPSTNVTPVGQPSTETVSEFSPKLTMPFSTETTESDQAKKLENILMNEMEFAISGPSEIETHSMVTTFAEGEPTSAQKSTESTFEEEDISNVTQGSVQLAMPSQLHDNYFHACIRNVCHVSQGLEFEYTNFVGGQAFVNKTKMMKISLTVSSGTSAFISEEVTPTLPHLTSSTFPSAMTESTADELNGTVTTKESEITGLMRKSHPKIDIRQLIGKLAHEEEERELKVSIPKTTDKVEDGKVTDEGQEQKPKVSVTEVTEKVELFPSTSSDYDYGTTTAIPTGTTHLLSVKFEELNYTGGSSSEISGFKQEETVPLIDFFLPEQETINETSKGTSMTFAESIERSLAFELDKGQSTLSSGFMETSDHPIEISEQEEIDSTPARTFVNPESAKDIDAQKSVTALVGQEEVVADAQMSPSKMCQETISFLTNPASSQSGIVYGFEIAANSTEHCAQLCYGKQCSSGVFIKPVVAGQLGSCLMAFGEEVCDQNKQRVTSYSGPFPVEISCIRCESFIVDQMPKVIKKTEYGDPLENKGDMENLHTVTKSLQESANASISHRTCLLNVSFEIVEPSFHSKSDFVSHKFATSVAECAKMCYESGCTVAGFTRANVDGEPSFCLLSFKSDTCAGTTRHTHAEPTKEPIQIQCIRCEVTGFELSRLPSSEEASELPNTPQPPKDEVSEIPIIDEENKKGCTDTICQQVDAATVSNDKVSTVAQVMVPSGKRNCTNRITFQAFQPAENYNVAFTSDHRSSSAADCAKQCYNEGNCQVSAFIAPPKGLSAGVCLLSEEPGFCKTNSEKLVEHSSISPFVISCIACSKCSFNIRNYIPSVPTAKPATWDSYFDDFEMQVDAENALECAEKCYSKKCSLAAYSPLTSNGNCLMTIKATRKCDGSDNSDPNVDTSGTLPLLIDCVVCA
ncbi:hypothetical protein M514_09606 [Trichuris suis]|uniref:Apple domain-containing protein n=1 Tax=Trichuris suis TaxID=68888 RepID=A0A085N873_9BILA|nr:hypothetical protein M514_09606 [Trichuris suis]